MGIDKMRFENGVTIARPIGEVFAYIAAIGHSPVWQGPVLEATALSSGPIGVGSRFSQRVRFLGRQAEQVLEVTTYQPPRLLAITAVSGPVPVTVTFRLREEGQGTRLDAVTEGKLGGVARLAAPAMERAARQQAQSDMETLKAVLEGAQAGR